MAFSDPRQIELLVLDVDGVMTAGQVILDGTGRQCYHFNVHDGSGIKYWHRSGGRTAIITGRSSPAVEIRAKQLGIEFVYQLALRKIEAFRTCLSDSKVPPERICVVGDDLPDLPIMRHCGYPVAVANAVDEVKESAACVTARAGGAGAVREVVELLLRARGAWSTILKGYTEQTL